MEQQSVTAQDDILKMVASSSKETDFRICGKFNKVGAMNSPSQ